MSKTILALLLGASLCLGSTAFAQSADDRKWVAQCLGDNADAKVNASVVAAYCVCMNDKMSDNEIRSVTQWEKANPNARRACEREAGWN